jgi:hypothetical protein
MFLISTRRAMTAVASGCLLLPLACSAAGGPGSQITRLDGTGGAAAASSMAGAAGFGGIGFGKAMESPTENAGAPPMIVVQPGEVQPSGGCTKPQNILFLIDRSGSMNCNPPPTTPSTTCNFTPVTQDPSMPTKLQIVEGALSTAFNQLLPTMANQPITRAGMAVLSTDDMCGPGPASAGGQNVAPFVPIQDVNPGFLDYMRGAMMSLIANGTTPIVYAVQAGYQYFMTNAAMLPGDKHLILVTDGADTCATRQEMATLINTNAPAALQMGIRTWVIGAPGSEPARSDLSHLAKAGGTPRPNCNVNSNCHYDMTMGDFAMTFGMALQEILSAVTCKVR